METLEQLKFKLNEKEQELGKLQLDIFILNPAVNQLVNEISELRKEIDALEQEEANG